MRQYERYLFMHLLWPTVVVTLSLTALVWLVQILNFIDFVLRRGLSLADFAVLTGLMLPSLLLILVPISFAIAAIYTYNKLMVESEIIVLNAIGISRWQLTRPALTLGLGLMALCYLLALYIMPAANERFQDIRTFFRDKYASVLLEEEVFNNPMNGVTVYIRTRDGDHLEGIMMHDSRNEAGPVTMVAERGRVEQTTSGPRFHLEQGMRQEWKDGRVSWLAFDSYTMDIAFYGQDVARKLSPSERSIFELFQRDGLTAKQAAAYRAEAHQRITWPLLAFTLPLFAIAMLFSSEFNRRGQLRRILFASGGMTLAVMAYFALRSVSTSNGNLVGGMYVVSIGMGLLGAHLLRDKRRAPMREVPV